MIYQNNSYQSILELERQRTGNYGQDAGDFCTGEACVRCGMDAEYEIDGQNYCRECLSEELQQAMQELIADTVTHDPLSNAARAILDEYIKDTDVEACAEDYFSEHRLI